MMKSHIYRRAAQDAALCIPMYEQSRVVNAIFPEIASFKGYAEGTSSDVIEAYAICVQVQTVLFDSHALLTAYLNRVYTDYRKEHPIRYWFIGDIVPLDKVVFVSQIDKLFRELLTLKVKTPVAEHSPVCLRHRIRAVQLWLKAMTELYTRMQAVLLRLESHALPDNLTCVAPDNLSCTRILKESSVVCSCPPVREAISQT
jgi:hypothetical protein